MKLEWTETPPPYLAHLVSALTFRPPALDRAAERFNSFYAFGKATPMLTCVHLRAIGFVGQTLVVEVYLPKTQRDQATSLGSVADALRLQTNTLYVEGPAASGKTTTLGAAAGGDLQQLSEHPLGLLSGLDQQFALSRHRLRHPKSNSPVAVDRSSWLSNHVYSGYHAGSIFLYQREEAEFLRALERVVILDDPTVSDEALHLRIQRRGLLDREMPLRYTKETRRLFQLVSVHYMLPTITADELQEELGVAVPSARYHRASGMRTTTHRRGEDVPDSASTESVAHYADFFGENTSGLCSA